MISGMVLLLVEPKANNQGQELLFFNPRLSA
jgi:hypothetical protein